MNDDKLSSVDLVDISLDRAIEVGSRLNAVTDIEFEGAYE
jgi:hypothetical protein